MPILHENLTFRRLQTDSPDRVTVFVSLDASDAAGNPVDGPWRAVDVILTAEEVAVAAAIVARAKQAECDRINATPE